jgi:hypothetical protein
MQLLQEIINNDQDKIIRWGNCPKYLSHSKFFHCERLNFYSGRSSSSDKYIGSHLNLCSNPRISRITTESSVTAIDNRNHTS